MFIPQTHVEYLTSARLSSFLQEYTYKNYQLQLPDRWDLGSDLEA